MNKLLTTLLNHFGICKKEMSICRCRLFSEKEKGSERTAYRPNGVSYYDKIIVEYCRCYREPFSRRNIFEKSRTYLGARKYLARIGKHLAST